MLNKLTKIANYFDSQKMYKESDWVDQLINKLARSCNCEDYPCCGHDDGLLTQEQVQERMEAEDYDNFEFEDDCTEEDDCDCVVCQRKNDKRSKEQKVEREEYHDTPLGDYYDDMSVDEY